MTQTATASVELLSFGAVAVRRKLANEQTDATNANVRSVSKTQPYEAFDR